MKKTLYHSELAGRGQIPLFVVSGPHPSKFAGKPPYFVVNDGGMERQYTTENQNCSNALAGVVGQQVLIQASGTRDAATIVILQSQPGQAPQPTQAAPQQPQGGGWGNQQQGNWNQPQQPQQGQQPAPQQGWSNQGQGQRPSQQAAPAGNTPETPEKTMTRIANLYITSLRAANYVRELWEHESGEPMPSDQFQACTSALFIEGNRKGLAVHMPVGRMEPRDPKQQ